MDSKETPDQEHPSQFEQATTPKSETYTFNGRPVLYRRMFNSEDGKSTEEVQNGVVIDLDHSFGHCN